MITENDFQNLVLPTLEDLHKQLMRNPAPRNKRVIRESEDITAIKVADLLVYMQQNNIPGNAKIMHNAKSVNLQWESIEPTTEDDTLKYIKRSFNGWKTVKAVHDILTENGYNRISVWSNEYKPYKNTSIYEMYISEEYDKLRSYFSLTFDK